jgi:hypothetical protein
MRFQEIFEYLCRKRLADGKNKNLKKVAEIILKIREEILKMMEPLSGWACPATHRGYLR